MFSIYLITNLVNGKQYVGMTAIPITRRWYLHRYAAKSPKTYFHKAIAKYGDDVFDVTHIACASSRNDLQELEKLAIAQYKTLSPLGYNQTIGGDGGDLSSGRKRSEAHIAAIRKAHIGKVVSEKSRARMRAAHAKIPWQEEWTIKATQNRPMTEKRRQAARRQVAQLSKAKIGVPLTDEHRQKISAGVRRARSGES